MATVSVTPERMAQLEEYAHCSKQDAATALDVAPAEYLEWERRDFEEAVAGIREGYEDMKAGRTQPVEEVLKSCASRIAFLVKRTT